MNELELLKKMYATVCGGADRAMTLLERGGAEEARRVLGQALEAAEKLYLSVEADPLSVPGGV